jgi:pyruvate dehydrogenase E1 component alpha subunit
VSERLAAWRSMPDPGPLAIFDNVYAEPNGQLLAERERYAAYLETFEDSGVTSR